MAVLNYEEQNVGLFSNKEKKITPTDRIKDEKFDDILHYDARSPYALDKVSPKIGLMKKSANKTAGETGNARLNLQKR